MAPSVPLLDIDGSLLYLPEIVNMSHETWLPPSFAMRN
jgi:hypothetical protein